MAENMNIELNDEVIENAAGGTSGGNVAPAIYKVGDRVMYIVEDGSYVHGTIQKVERSTWQDIPGQDWLYTIRLNSGKIDWQFEIDIHPEA